MIIYLLDEFLCKSTEFCSDMFMIIFHMNKKGCYRTKGIAGTFSTAEMLYM